MKNLKTFIKEALLNEVSQQGYTKRESDDLDVCFSKMDEYMNKVKDVVTSVLDADNVKYKIVKINSMQAVFEFDDYDEILHLDVWPPTDDDAKDKKLRKAHMNKYHGGIRRKQTRGYYEMYTVTDDPNKALEVLKKYIRGIKNLLNNEDPESIEE